MIDLLMNFLKNDSVDWKIYFQIGSTLAHNGYEFQVFDDWCKLIGKEEYNARCDNLQDWNSWVRSNEHMNVGGIVNLLKRKPKDYKVYTEKYCKNNEIRVTLEQLEYHNELLNYLRPFLFETIRYSNTKWYVYKDHNCLWEHLPNIQIILLNFIHKLCDKEIHKLRKKIKDKKAHYSANDSDDEEDSEEEEAEKKTTAKEIKKLEKKLKSWHGEKKRIYSGIGKIETLCEVLLLDNDFESRLDKEVGTLAFKNGILHIETGILKDICYDNYLTKVLPYNYQKGNEDEKKEIRTHLLKICNMNPKLLEYMLSIFGYALTGYADKEQLFWVFYGSNGSNGKSLILDVLSKILHHYCCGGNTKMLQEGSNKEHKSIPSVVKSRIAWFNELPKTNKINSQLLKHLRDGTSIKNEVLFGTEATHNVQCKMFMVSNHKVNFGKDGGMNRSIKQIGFNSTFYDENKLNQDDEENLQFVKDKDLGQKLVNMKYSFIELLCEYGQRYMKSKHLADEPTEVQEETKNLIKQNDKFYTWFDNHFQVEADKFTHIDDMLHMYPQSQQFEDAKTLKVWFMGEMKRLGFLYKRHKMIDGKRGFYENVRKKTVHDYDECLIKTED